LVTVKKIYERRPVFNRQGTVLSRAASIASVTAALFSNGLADGKKRSVHGVGSSVCEV